jgi:hypothetical protein
MNQMRTTAGTCCLNIFVSFIEYGIKGLWVIIIRYEKDRQELDSYDQNNNIFKNNFCKKKPSPCPEVLSKFSDQLIEALIVSKNLFSPNK